MDWQNLHRLTQDEDSEVRTNAAYALSNAFSQLPDPDRTQAWQDLHRLTQDEDSYVRESAADALVNVFSQLPDPDRTQAWQDLHRLTRDEDSYVRGSAAGALVNVFSQMPDKEHLAWKNLQRLTRDEDSYVRGSAAGVLVNVFFQVPDREHLAWKNLHRLTQDKDSYVRVYAYHSLGRAYVFMATEAKDNETLKRYLKDAVNYFEKSSQESSQKRFISNPARFCYPFYRTYFAIAFQDAKGDEVQKYLAEAKDAVGGSESKDELLKAVENLANALKESQRLKERPIKEIADELNVYRWFCEKAAEHMTAAEDKAPGAVKLMRKGNPFLEERIQATIAEIQKTARQICKTTHGSGGGYEALGTEINKASKSLSSENIHKTQRCVSRIVSQLKEFCKLLPKGKRELVCGSIEEIGLATEFPDKLDKIELSLTYVSSAVETALQSQNTIETVLKALEMKGDPDQRFKELLDRLEAVIAELDVEQIENPTIKQSVEDTAEYIKDPELNIKNRLVCTIPLIPILLTYQGIIEYQSGLNLLAAWNKLVGSVHK